jgi:hypothetical protein
LHFVDGTVWTSQGDPWFAGRERLRDIAGFVAARSGIPIVQLEVMERDEL